MKKAFIFLFLATLSTYSHADNSDIEKKINIVNKLSEESLGISLLALAYLVKAHPQSHLTFDYMESEDKAAIKELEKAEYVQTEIRIGLPDGTHNNLQYIRVIPNHRGSEVQRCMLALQNKE